MNISRIIIKKFLNEAVTGDEAAASIAKAKVGVEKAKSRLQKLGIYDIPELKGLYTMEQLSIEPFKFNFLLQVKDNQQELTLPKPVEFNTLARVIKNPESENLLFEIKLISTTSIDLESGTIDVPSGSLFKISIDKNELTTKLPGTKKDILAIKEESFYNISVNDDFINLLIEKKPEPEIGDEGKEAEGTEDGGEEKETKKGNFYRGKDLKEVNQKLSDSKDKAKWFSITKQYKDDPEFQDIFLDAIIDSTKSIKINQKPLYVTLKELRSNGLLEAPESMSGRKRNYLKFKLNLQNFMVDVFSLFAKMSKNGKDSQTHQVIKDFYKQLFLIASKGRTSISDQQTRKQLLKKLFGTFSNFLSTFSKLPEMVKGSAGKKQQGKEIKVKSTPRATINTVESYYGDGNFLFEQDEDENTDETKPFETDRFISKIYVDSITLGPKAKAKRGEDVNSYSEKVKGTTKWDGLVNSLPDKGAKLNVDIELSDENLTTEQERVFNTLRNILRAESYQGSAIVRKSKKITDNTVFVVEFGGKALVCKVKQGVNLKNVTEIEIGPKAGGEDIFDKSTKAKIQIS